MNTEIKYKSCEHGVVSGQCMCCLAIQLEEEQYILSMLRRELLSAKYKEEVNNESNHQL